MDSEASDIGPRKRKVPINDNGEAVNIPKVKKKRKVAPLSQPSAHTLSSTSKKAKSRAQAVKSKTRQAAKPAPASAVDSDHDEDMYVEPEQEVISVVTDASDDEPEILEVPDVKTNEEELGL
jgi:hypothetical protein